MRKFFKRLRESVCRVEPLERRALLAGDFSWAALASHGPSAPSNDLLADASAPQFITTPDMQGPMPFRGGDRNSIVAPLGPTNLSAVAASSTRVELSWTDASNNERGFHIYRSTDAKMYELVGTIRARSTGFADLGAAAGTQYHYKVAAFNDYGYGFSQSVSITTPEAGEPAEAPAARGPNRA